MSSFRAGTIFYTVEVDSKTLKRVKDQIAQVGQAARQAAGGSGKVSSEFRELKNQANDLNNRLRALNNDFRDAPGGLDKYRASMEKVYAEAGTLRSQFEALGGEMVENSGDAAMVSAAIAQLSGIQERAGRVVDDYGGKARRLGETFDSIQNEIYGIGSEVRKLNSAMDVGKVDVSQYSSGVGSLRDRLTSAETRLLEFTRTMKLSRDQSRKLSSALGQIQRHTTAMDKGMKRATGSIASMGMASQLSYGATTLLNDRIFQMSPALGILTNQLNFTTKGMRAWLAAILPIIAVAGSLIAVIGGLVVSLKAGVGLESALADVRKTTNLTDGELSRITDTFQDLSKEIPVAVNEMLDIAKVAGQLGIVGVENIERFTKTIAELGVATDVVGEEGATQLARFLNALGTDMDDMGTSAERVANILNSLENTTAATASEILAMTSYTQGLSSQAGATDAEILALNATLLSLGVKAEAGGSAIVRTMSDIQIAGVEGGDALERYAKYANMTVDEFGELARNAPVDALVALAAGLNDAAGDGQNLNSVLNELGVIEVRERRALLALAQGADVLSSSISTANEEAEAQTSLSREVAIQSETTAAKLERLKNRFVALAQDVGTMVNPAFKAFVDLLTWVVDNSFSVVGSLTAITGAFLAMKTIIMEVYTGTKLFAAIAAGLTGPGGILIAIGAATGIGVTAWQRYATAIDKAIEASQEATEAIGKVNDKDSLLGVVNELATNLEGDAKNAWVTMATQAIASADDIDEVKARIMRAYLEIANSAEIARVEHELFTAQVDIDRIEAQVEEGRGRYGSSASGRKNAEEDIAELEAQIVSLQAKLAELNGTNIEFTVTATTPTVVPGSEGVGTPGTSGGVETNPIQGIGDQYNQTMAELGTKFHVWGEMTFEEFKQAQVDAARAARNQLLEIFAGGGEYAEEAEKALWGYHAQLLDWLKVMENLAEEERQAEEQLFWYKQYYASRVAGLEGVQEDERQAAEEQLFWWEQYYDSRVEAAELAAEEERDALAKFVFWHQRGYATMTQGVEEATGEQQKALEEHQEWLAQQRQDPIDTFTGMDTAMARALVGVETLQGAWSALYSYFGTVTPEMAAMIEDMFEDKEIEEFVDSLTSAEQAIRDLGDSTRGAFDASGEAINGLRDRLGELDILYSQGVISEQDYLSEQLRIQQQLLEAMALSGRDWGDAMERARREIERITALQAKSGMGKGTPGGLPGLNGAKTGTSEIQSGSGAFVSALEVASSGLQRFAGTILGVASQSALVSSVLEGFKFKVNDAGDMVVTGFDPLTMFISILGRVLEKSEGFQSTLELLDSALDPLVEIADQLFTALEPIIKVAVELVKVALTPFMIIMESVIVPVLEFVARVIAGIWNAIARAINSLPGWMRGGRTFQEIDLDAKDDGIDARPGSIDYYEELLAKRREEFGGATSQAERDRLAGEIEDLEETIRDMSGQNPPEGSIAYYEQQLADARKDYAEATSEQDRQDALAVISELEETIRGLKGESGSSSGGTAGTTVSEITGPTRDLLMDLLRPLSILPTWTSWIRDIRNDVRAMALGSGYNLSMPSMSTQLSSYSAVPSAGTVYHMENVTITTSANSVRDLARDISKFTYKERRGGK